MPKEPNINNYDIYHMFVLTLIKTQFIIDVMVSAVLGFRLKILFNQSSHLSTEF